MAAVTSYENALWGGEMVMKPGNFVAANKDAKVYVGRTTTVHNILFCSCTMHEVRYQNVSNG